MAGVAIIALAGTPAAALALDQHIVDNVQHFVECWGYMWTDEASHIEFCSPSQTGPVVWAAPRGPFILSVSPSAWSDQASHPSESSQSSSEEEESSSSSSSSEEQCVGSDCPPPTCEYYEEGCDPA